MAVAQNYPAPGAHHTCLYRGAHASVEVGAGLPVRVNLSVGLGGGSTVADELRKIRDVLAHARRSDLMMDLSVIAGDPEPWRVLVEEFAGPVGFLPHYLCADSRGRLDAQGLLRRIEDGFRLGVAFVTIHVAPTRDLFDLARAKRAVPVTSRGGAVVLRDMLARNAERSIFAETFDEVARLAARHGAVINLGAAFRAACVADGTDQVVLAEVAAQEQWVQRAHELGAMVTLEGPGHILLGDVPGYVRLTEHLGVPRMPLGPMVTDAHGHADHVVSAIGAAMFGACARGGIINAVTRVEHQGGVPSAPVLIEAVDAAIAAAHAASITYHPASRSADDAIARARAQAQTCAVTRREADGDRMVPTDLACARCGRLCPLIRDSYVALPPVASGAGAHESVGAVPPLRRS